MRNLLRSLVFVGLSLALAVPASADPTDVVPVPDLQRGIEVQARGPVHEAFAQPVSSQPEPGPLVPQAPPEPVPEEPPDQAPEGRNVQWIGGYWSWDADRNEFVWVSGTYRDAPPGRQYVPGYWENEANGWRWVPGFWGPETQAELPYVPPPPAPPDANGPSVPPPDENSFYNPGSWAYQQDQYAWRPGSWQPYQPGWVWVPAQYVWTPSGCVFVSGYWDYPLERRGMLFAPVCFTQPLWQTPGWVYQPAYTVGCGPLLNAFFVGPRRRHYYFGDYYGNACLRAGYNPWFNNGPGYYDPLFGYARWRNRGNPGWQAGLRQLYLDRVAGRAPLPPRTLGQQVALLRRTPGAGNLHLVTPISQLGGPNLRVTRLSPAQRGVQRTNAQRMHQLALTRSRTETVRLSPRGPVGGGGPGSLRVLRSLPLSGGAGRTPRPQGALSQGARPSASAHVPGLSPRPHVGAGGMPKSGAPAHPRPTAAWPGHSNPYALPSPSHKAASVAPRVIRTPPRSPAAQPHSATSKPGHASAPQRPPAPQYRTAINHTRPAAVQQPHVPHAAPRAAYVPRPQTLPHAAPRPQAPPVHQANVAHHRPAAPAVAHRPAPARHAPPASHPAPAAHRAAPAHHAATARHSAPAHQPARGGGAHAHH
jgi:hypothetical protein